MVPAPPPPRQSDLTEEPQLLIDARLVILWTRSEFETPEMGISRIRIIGPDGGEFSSPEVEIDLTKVPRSRSIGRLGAFPFPLAHEGQYNFKIELKNSESEWLEASELPLLVLVQSDSPSG